ncbi:hypothetical protein E4633_02920 [Geomonas terrae]|uniref:Fibronectin type-III domain-containing protein n=1 Tax=Geomonas terrae TaxID=2562681 RepID=A0A4V3P075_9BACT|nr:fibronectin type III domain-containing protein [Geomonas terrae]TGU74432.1 hypothetical protein E4633_02920 [Geomonas terrae]
MLLVTVNPAFAWTVAGTVYGGSAPLEGVTVTAFKASDQSEAGKSTTGTGGGYSIALENGTYNLTIAPPLSSNLGNSVVNGVVVSGGDVTQNVVLVQTANYLSGVVRTGSGVAVGRVFVKAVDQASGTLVGQQVTNERGEYSIPVSTGTYRIDILGGAGVYDSGACDGYCIPSVPAPQYFEYVSILSNLSVAGDMTQDITLPLVTLSGKCTDANGVAVAGVKITQASRSVYPEPDNYQKYVSSFSNIPYFPVVESDASGNYVLGMIEGAGYSLTVTPPPGSVFSQSVVNNVNVSGPTKLDIMLQRANYLSGVVRTGSGTVVGRVFVKAVDQASGTLVGQQVTNDRGEYSIPVSAGTYRIDILGGAGVYDSGACDGYCIPSVPAPQYFEYVSILSNLSVAGDMTQDITLPLVTLSGKCTDANGVAVAGVKITQASRSVYPEPDNYQKYVSSFSNIPYFPVVESDASGNYVLGMIEGAGYSLTVTPPPGGAFSQSVVNNVNVSGPTKLDIILQRANYLSGVVRTGSGTVVGRVFVKAVDQASGTLVGQQVTNERGEYSIPVSTGTYRIDILGGAGVYDSGACDGYCIPSVPAPQYFEYVSILSNLSVAGDMTQDITLPLVTLSGKCTDANGVAVAGVKITQASRSVYPEPDNYQKYVSSFSNIPYFPVVESDDSGNYVLGMIEGTGYSLTVTPPSGSGFSQTVINGVNATKSLLQNVILVMPDAAAPVIISGPLVSSSTDSTATIEWETNEPAKGGVLVGAAFPPAQLSAEMSLAVKHVLPLTGLSPNTTYYIQVTATDVAGNGPTSSKIISFSTKPVPDTVPPVVLTGPVIVNITHESAAVEWTTNEPSTGTVFYGTTTPDKAVADTALATVHRVLLAGLTPETLYTLKLDAVDAVNNGPTSTGTSSFRTLALPDTTAPRIVEGPMAVNVSDTGATIIWKTDEPATSGVSWNDGTAYGLLSDDSLGTSHAMRVTGLKAQTAYSFIVSSKDGFGNGPTLSQAAGFTTLPTPDQKPPVIILQPVVKNVNHQMALIYWETDEPSDSVIEFGTTTSFDSTDAKAELQTKHNRPLTGLVPGTTYFFRVLATDASGNGPAASQTYSFTTDLIPSSDPPVLTQAPEIVYANDTSATVYFETDKPCDTVVEYGEGVSITNRQSDGTKLDKHQVTITNLAPNTPYGMEISCTDINGNSLKRALSGQVTSVAKKVSALADVGGAGFVTKTVSDTTAPGITALPTVTALSPNQATVVWSTDEIADSMVSYNVDGTEVILTAGDIAKTFSHSLVLTNLTAGSTYRFTVRSVDPAGNAMTSSGYAFTTPLTVPGDACRNDDGTVRPFNVQSVINMFLGLKGAAPCADVDNNGKVGIAELRRMIDTYLGR